MPSSTSGSQMHNVCFSSMVQHFRGVHVMSESLYFNTRGSFSHFSRTELWPLPHSILCSECACFFFFVSWAQMNLVFQQRPDQCRQVCHLLQCKHSITSNTHFKELTFLFVNLIMLFRWHIVPLKCP